MRSIEREDLVTLLQDGENSKIFDELGISSDSVFLKKRIICLIRKARQTGLDMQRISFSGGIVKAELNVNNKLFVVDIGTL